MVDFANSNLCGASPEMNDLFKKLDEAAADIESKIDEAASTAAAAFASAQTELNSLTAQLQSIEIPQLPKLNLQAEIKALSELVPGTPAYLSSLATITKEFGADLEAAGKDLGTLISDGLSAITSGGNICNVVPNVEKEAGSTNPATEKATNVLQAAVAPETETVSVVVQNIDVTSKTTEITTEVNNNITPLGTTDEPLTVSTGSYKVTEDNKVKEISTAAGTTKVITKKVETVEERSNVTPRIQSHGFVHRISSKKVDIDFADCINKGRDSFGRQLIEITLPDVVADSYIEVTQYNLAENEVSIVEDNIGKAYKETYGIHGQHLWEHPDFKNLRDVIKIDGNKITVPTPYSLQGNHPGNLTSITYTTDRRGDPEIKTGTFFAKTIRGRLGGRLIYDDFRNKKYKGKQFTVSYSYRDNYDPESK